MISYLYITYIYMCVIIYDYINYIWLYACVISAISAWHFCSSLHLNATCCSQGTEFPEKSLWLQQVQQHSPCIRTQTVQTVLRCLSHLEFLLSTPKPAWKLSKKYASLARRVHQHGSISSISRFQGSAFWSRGQSTAPKLQGFRPARRSWTGPQNCWKGGRILKRKAA